MDDNKLVEVEKGWFDSLIKEYGDKLYPKKDDLPKIKKYIIEKSEYEQLLKLEKSNKYKSVRIYPDSFKRYKRLSHLQRKKIVELIDEALILLEQKYDEE